MTEKTFVPNEVRLDGRAAHLTVQFGEQFVEAAIDAKELGRVLAAGRWYAQKSKDSQTPYVMLSGARGVSLHRFIMGFPPGLDVDHRDHNGLNCRQSNLRTCTHTQNMQNRRGAHRTSKSGVRGVYWHKSAGKWVAEVRANRKKTVVGHFGTLDEAKTAVERARLALHGEFAS